MKKDHKMKFYLSFNFLNKSSFVFLIIRGGVGDTKLEDKAKETKKSEAKGKGSPSEDRPSRGQGQECSRPRTKDTGGKCSPPKKQKGLQNFFSGDL